MNQNDIAYIISAGICFLVLFTVIVQQFKRIKGLEKDYNQLMLQWQTWAASKVEDYPTARLMGGIARQRPSAGAIDVSVEEKKPKTEYTILQSSG